jgi:hypothetical protein
MIAPSASSLELRVPQRQFPGEFEAPPATWKWLCGWLLIGVAVRAILLPLAVHPDLLAVYDRARRLSGGGLHWFDLHLQTLPIALHWLFAKVSGAGLPVLDGLPWPTASRDSVYEFVVGILSRPGALLELCAWKLPYLIADVGCGLLCWRLAPPTLRAATLRTWMLHPFVIFVSVAFGKYEAWMALPFLLGLLSLRSGRDSRAFLLFGVAIAMRIYPALFVLPMALCAGRTLRRRAELLALSVAPLAIVLVCGATRSALSWIVVPAAAFAAWRLYRLVRQRRFEWLALAAAGALAVVALPLLERPFDNASYPVLPILRHAAFLVHTRLAMSSSESLLLFVLAYGAILLSALHTARARADDAARIEEVGDAGLLAMLAFAAFGFSLPQYEYLLVPLVLLQFHRCKEARIAHAVQLAGLLLLLLDSPFGDRTTWLFAPIAPDVLPLTRPPAQLLVSPNVTIPWVSFGRTLLVLGSAWLAFDLLRTRARRESVPPLEPRRGALAFAASALAWPLGLAGLIVLALRSPADEPIGAERTVADFNVARPLDGYRFRVEESAPTSLELRLEDGQAVAAPGHRIRVERVPAGDGDAPAGAGQELIVPAAALVPSEEGTLRIDLAKLDLASHSDYVVRWQRREAFGAIEGARLRLMREIPASELVDRFTDDVRRRFFSVGAFGTGWIAGALMLGAAGAVLARAGRRRATILGIRRT